MLAVVLSPWLHGQIVYPTGDDAFGASACCSGVHPNLPQIVGPTVLGSNQLGRYGILEDCQLKVSHDVTVTVNLFPHPGGTSATEGLPACDEFVARIDVKYAANGMTFSVLGNNPASPNDRERFVLAKYVRTWTGLGPDGQTQFRFWHYMLEGDANSFDNSPTALIPGSDIPSCWSANPVHPVSFGNVVFRGYLILMSPLEDGGAYTTVNGQDYTLVLSHYDGCLDHLDAPNLNERAIASGLPTKHVGRSYHIVTPCFFQWTTNPPLGAALEFTNTSMDSLRSTVSHTTLGNAPGPLCLGEMPLVATSTTDSVKCNCITPGAGGSGALDHNQVFLSAANYGLCGGASHHWNSYYLVPEIPTGFTQTYLGHWLSSARPDLRFVRTTLAVGTIQYADHCAAVNNYVTNEEHIIWGNALLWPALNASNVPTIQIAGASFVTDYMLHFGNHVDKQDVRVAGVPAYVNVIWNLIR